ncbi:MAG: ArnT family glycosyltransferase [Candidatus Poribacteria bacterium]
MKIDIIDWIKRNLILLPDRLIYVIVGTAFILRVSMIFIISTPEETTNVWPMTESIVNNLLGGNGYSIDGVNPDLYIFPVYPFFLAFLRILHISFFYAKIVQCFIGALICLVIYQIGKRIFSEKIGLLAGFLWAIYPYSVVHSKALEDSTLLTFFVALTMLLVIIFMEKRNYLNAILLGLVCGLSVMTRNTFFAFLPFFLIWLIVYLRKKYLRHILIIIFIISLIVVPWVIRNYIHSGYVTLTTHGGSVVWIGNNQYINSLLKANLNQDYIIMMPGLVNILCSPQEDRVYYQKAINFILSNPKTFIENVFLKLYYFYGWNYYFRQVPVPGDLTVDLTTENIEKIKAEADRVYSQPYYKLRSIMYSISAFPLFLMAVGGFFTSSIKSKYHQLTLIFIISFTAVHILSIANIRHRQPIDAIFTLYAANFIFWVINKLSTALYK